MQHPVLTCRQFREDAGTANESGCIHCHMLLSHDKAEGSYVAVQSNSRKLTEELLCVLNSESEAPDSRWEFLDDNGAAYRYRVTVEDQKLFVAVPKTQSPHSSYRQKVSERLMEEAEGYLLLLELDNKGSAAARDLLDDLERHSADVGLQQKKAGVLLIRQEGDTQQEPDGTLLYMLSRMFSDAVSQVHNRDVLQQPQVLYQAIEDLAGAMGLLPPKPDGEEPFWQKWIHTLLPTGKGSVGAPQTVDAPLAEPCEEGTKQSG
jgi:hypothetical protein